MSVKKTKTSMPQNVLKLTKSQSDTKPHPDPNQTPTLTRPQPDLNTNPNATRP